ncbi:MAG: type II and III secretion system protein, partial [Bacteroidetes bacterium]|nr:type II and III secretion system protein [Bacteroidota bacterium]
GKATQTIPTGARDAARPAGALGTPAATPAQPEVVDSSEIYAKLREITISSIFFEVNQTKLSQVGARFSIFRGRDLNLGIEFDGTKKIETPIFGASLSPTNPKLAVDINAGLSLIESNQLGEVIARPQVTVRSTASARIQVGTDFSTREKDFSGNIVEKFYSTGTILTVRPKVYTVGDVEFIDLQYSIERSTVTPGEVTTLINKTLASGSLSLLNGEESYVGGMFSNEEIVLREGVPFLKDLPWWVFGLRYLFGYDSKQINRKELIVLLKAEMLPLVGERAARPSRKDMMQERLRENQQELEKRSRLKNEKP